jgi:hypothetical protein
LVSGLVETGVITAITVGNCISDFIVPEWNNGGPSGISGLARYVFLTTILIYSDGDLQEKGA